MRLVSQLSKKTLFFVFLGAILLLGSFFVVRSLLTDNESQTAIDDITKREPTEEELIASNLAEQALASRQGKTQYEVVAETGDIKELQRLDVIKANDFHANAQFKELSEFVSGLDVSSYEGEQALSLYTLLSSAQRNLNDLNGFVDTLNKIVKLDIIEKNESLLSYWQAQLETAKSGSFPPEVVPDAVRGDGES